METYSGTEKKKKVHLTDFNSGWCFSFNVQAGQVGHVENSVGQGADSAGQAGHEEHSVGQGDIKNTVLDKGQTVLDKLVM